MNENCDNLLLIAAAGSGKTRFLVERALADIDKKTLITTYTRSNSEEIRRKIREKNKDLTGENSIPPNIVIEEWFTFLLRHGVRPLKSFLSKDLRYKQVGFRLVNERSGAKNKEKNIYWGEEENLLRFYFGKGYRIFSDKISKFVYECNKVSNGCFTERISTYFDNVYIDEVQDLAGWDLEILKLLFKSNAKTILVGDPRQTVYLTHHDKKHPKYKNGKIDDFVREECKQDNVCVDYEILNKTHRNNVEIAQVSSKLYPTYPETGVCDCRECRASSSARRGVFLIRGKDIPKLQSEDPHLDIKILRFRESSEEEMNVGVSKGLTFDRVIIYPTKNIVDWIIMRKKAGELAYPTRAKFYVALTRARHAVFVVYDYSGTETLADGVRIFDESDTQVRLLL